MNQFFKTLLAIALPTMLLCSPAHADTQVHATSFTYDANGLLITQTVEPDSPNDCLQSTYTYSDTGQRNHATSSTCAGAAGFAVASASTPRTSSVTFTRHFPTIHVNALGQTESMAYDVRRGTPNSQQDANGQTTQWSYDGFARKTQERRPDATSTGWTYLLCTDAGANCPATVGPATVAFVTIEQEYQSNNNSNAPEKRKFLDNRSRVVRVQSQGFDGSGTAPVIVQDTEYNAQGLVSRASQPYALSGGTPVWTSYQYDGLGRIAQESRPDLAAPGGVAVTTYTYNGLTTSSTNSSGQTKTAIKDTRGQILKVIDAKGSAITYSYDAVGNVTQVNVAGSITTIGYNQRGLKTSMVDPAMGSWIYGYNAFGELVYQRDSLNQVTTMDYDLLGRMIKRTEPDLTSQWSYDNRFDGTVCGQRTAGVLCEAIADNGYRRLHVYDSVGRLTTTTTVLDNPASPAVVTETYDPNRGFVTSKTWPTGAKATYGYTPFGFLSSVTATASVGTGTTTVTYSVLAVNAQGQVTQYKTGNHVTTVKNFDPQTNRLLGVNATLDGQSTGNVLNQAYTYDAVGNLLSRSDNTPGIGTQENFSYDAVNRLTLALTNGGAQMTEVMYDDRGNITYKSDVGTYWYDAARPNRMTNVTLETALGASIALSGRRALSYAFDDTMTGAQTVGGITMGNGNLQYTVSQDTVNNIHSVRGESYTSFNMPRQIVYGNFITATTSTADRTLTFVYSPEHQRLKKTLQLSGNGTSAYTPGTTYYLNGIDSLGLSFEKEITASGMVQNKHYISAAGQVFALLVTRSGNLGTQTAVATSYLHQDNLGSVSAITDGTGAVVERLAYDPWGKRRNTNGLADSTDSIVAQKTDRGYTMQEQLDEIDVVHMNARIYDPLIGRFMSADSIIPNPTDMKAFNRYSYVNNNPLRGVDPTGHVTAFVDPRDTPVFAPGATDYQKWLALMAMGCDCVIPAYDQNANYSIPVFTPTGFPSSGIAPAPSLDGATGPVNVVDNSYGPAGTTNGDGSSTSGDSLAGASDSLAGAPDSLAGGSDSLAMRFIDSLRPAAGAADQLVLLGTARLTSDAFKNGEYVDATVYAVLGATAGSANVMLAVLSDGASLEAQAIARGGLTLNGTFSKTINAAGGDVYTSAGTIYQSTFSGIVNNGLYKGTVDILSGVHGSPTGVMTTDLSLYAADISKFGNLAGVTVHNIADMTQSEINAILNKAGTIIGGFCDSGVCLLGK
jgi:RHS repeat-associated protein